jgi:hypothetical protein
MVCLFKWKVYICNIVAKKIKLVKSLSIKKLVASLLLIVFAFSITPTIVFHNWLANHTDTCKRSSDTKAQQLGKQTFNCHCDHIVAESPFTEPETFKSLSPLQIFALTTTVDIVQLPSSKTIFYSLRGPPVV